ncbi:hypothetical protein [Actinobacillus porcinus]|uniref:hypothetical protein n=1 Tax=Actinobacillus porcinus TaxID=51048 RepID=UPI0023F08EC5|nr:hypothetical protein [Actinobacillus porcinus]MDD7545570.1 hypothetical protein [Actinobacillus porcinus]MDY5847637.1 hypothetical protein [Actinobacillus porcinus]
MRKLLIACFSFVMVGCYSIDEIEKTTPSNNFITNKTLEEFSNCIRMEWGMQVSGIQEMNIPNGKRFFKADMGYVGFLINIKQKDERHIQVESFIPSSDWAVIPKRLKEATERCRI